MEKDESRSVRLGERELRERERERASLGLEV